MDAKLAEVMVKTWQNIKSQALGPSHSLEKLSEVCQNLSIYRVSNRKFWKI